MGDEHHRGAKLFSHAVDELQDLRLDGDVERRGGLVADEQLRLAGERHGDHDALAHAARQLVRVALEDLLGRGDAHELDHLEGARVGVGLAHLGVVHEDALADLVAGAHDRVERGHGLLEDHADLVAAVGAHLVARELGEVCARQLDRAVGDLGGRRRQKAHDRQGRHRLAAAALAHDGERLALAHLERQARDGGQGPVLGEQRHVEVLDASKDEVVLAFLSLGVVAPLPWLVEDEFRWFSAERAPLSMSAMRRLPTSASWGQARRAARLPRG